MTNLADLAQLIVDARKPKKTPTPIPGVELLKKVSDKTISYTGRHRGQWFRPEYDFAQIQIAQDVDSYFFRAIKKKVDRFMIAGYEFHGSDPDVVLYIKRRISEIELATSVPFAILLQMTAHDMFRYSNAMWVKVRDLSASTGKIRVNLAGKEIDPVAGYFLLPFETLEFKTKPNGELVKLMQRMEEQEREFFPENVIHFYANKKPGFAVGTPETLAALDDIALLRRIEENVEELIETNLFPTFHYKVGNDEFPETVGPNGLSESMNVKRTLEYMPSHGVYVSDHRHEIVAIGSENKALRIDFYLTYFKNRVLAALGTSPVDMGEGDTANRATAATMSKTMIQDVEAMQVLMKRFIEFFVINELLLEGGYNPLDEKQQVEIKFGIIDREQQATLENQAIQLWHAQGITHGELRKRLGTRSFRDEDFDDTYFKRFEEPLQLLKGMGPGTAASKTLGDLPHSNITPEAVKQEEQYAEKKAKEAAAAKTESSGGLVGRPSETSGSTGSKNASAAKSRPSNGMSTRAAPKFTKDVNGINPLKVEEFSIAVDRLNDLLEERARLTKCSPYTVYDNLAYRFDNLIAKYSVLE